MIKLIKPSKQYLQGYLQACKEFSALNIDSVSYHNPTKYDTWKDTIFQRYEKDSKSIDLPYSHVPSTKYWLIDNDTYIGSGSI